MSSSTTVSSHAHRRASKLQRRMTWTGLLTILSLIVSLFPQVVGSPMPTASAHNLQTRMVSMFMDSATQAVLDARMSNPGWTPPDPLLQSGDELGLIIKVVPRDGTTTGVGGHIDFYVPNGVQVTNVGYVVPDGAGGFTLVSMKGQSPIAIGDGPIGAKSTSQLVDATGWTGYTNINGVTEAPVVPASGLHRGTIAGVYGDTGIFFSTDPDTAYGSWQKYTGDWNANPSLNKCGSLAFTAANGKTLVNNSGDTVVPCNKWDAEQLMAWGVKGGTFGATAPIVDYGDGRGNAPWGFASGVGGPQSGYKWNFDWDEWQASGKTAADMRNAMGNDEVGPWKRIEYNGDRISYDQPGLDSTALGYASIDAGDAGDPVSVLPATTSQTDTTSPKTIRWAVGQLTAFRPEYAWVKIKVNSAAEILDPSGCPVFKADTFGGDAGGTDNGKDHLWRYYEPTEVTWNGCLAAQKTASREIVKVGDTYQYKLKVYNFQNFTLSTVKVTDPLPSGVTFVSAVPAQSSGPNPLVWNVGTLLPGQKWEATVTVKAASTGFIDNCINIDSAQLPTQTVCDSTVSGSYPYLVPSKAVTPTTVSPGGTVTYDLLVKNVGSGPSGSPVMIDEQLPAGFTYQSLSAVYVNGAAIAGTTVNSTNPNLPSFSVPAAIQGAKELKLTFTALVGQSVAGGSYCNTYRVVDNGVPITTGSEACVTVGAGTIGDTVFRDWNNSGTQDPEDEGILGVTVNLYNGACPPSGGVVKTTTTDASGKYLFAGLNSPASYCVDPVAPASYTSTTPPDPRTITLAQNETNLTADFGFKPGGAGAIGDTVFDDQNNDGVFNGVDAGIAGVTLTLYEDTNGNGVVDAGQDAQLGTTTTGACPGASCGVYSFTNLDPTRGYLVVATDGAGSPVDTYFANPYVSSTGNPQKVTPADFTAQGNAVTDADFGYFGQTPGSIGDTVCRDTNGNGLCDPGEPGIANITVLLYQDLNADGVIEPGVTPITVMTSPTGFYTFGNLAPMSYVVVADFNDPDLPDGYVPSVLKIPVTLSAGQNVTNADFPFTPLITKAVDKASALAGDPLNFTINLNYRGSALLTDARVVDPVPAGVTNINTINLGGAVGAFVPQVAADGLDDQDTWSTTMQLAASPDTLALGGGNITVSMVVASSNTADTPANITNVTPTLEVDGGSATCGAPTPATQTLPKNGSVSFSFTCTPTSVGEFTFIGSAIGTITTAGDYEFAQGTSDSTLVSKTGSTQVITWNLGSNVEGVQGALSGGGTAGTCTISTATADSYIDEAKKTSNFDSTNVMKIKTKGGSNKRGLVQFDLSACPPSGATITGAQLQLRSLTDVKKSTSLSFYQLSQSWTETGVTWNSRNGTNNWTTAGGTYAPTVMNTPTLVKYAKNTTYNFPLNSSGLAVLGGWSTTPANNFGFLLRAGNDVESRWATQETPNDPKLVINYLTGTGAYASTTDLYAAPTLASCQPSGTCPVQVQVDMVVENVGQAALTGITPPTNLTPATTGGTGTVAKLSGPTPAGPVDLNPGASQTFSYVYNVTAGATAGTVKFSGQPTPTNRWASATSNDVIVVPPLTFKANVVSPIPGGLTMVENYASLSDSGVIPSTPSNTTQTALGASIGDFVWADLDGDGVQDPTEPGLAGVQVCANPGSRCATTDALGKYLIGGLTNGTSYNVTLMPGTIPAGYAPTTPTTLAVTATTAGTLTADFGLQPPGTATIGDTVWLDANNNGSLDGTESGLPGITVKLYIDQNNNGAVDGGDTLIQITTTDATGKYLFSGLNPDDYLVQVDTASAVTSPYDGSTTIAAAMAPTTGTTNPRDVTITTAGQAVLTADFGYNWSGSIGDYVWWDNNINRLQDESPATPIAGAIVLLYFDFNNNGVLDPINGDYQVRFAQTNASGLYLFDNLPPGKYFADVYEDSITTDGNRDIVPTTLDVQYKNLGPNEDYLAADFGYYVAAKVEGNVFWDEDHNGVLDDDEQDPAHLLQNITVNIVCLGPDGVAGGVDDYTGSMDTGTQGLPNGHFAFIVPPGPCTLTYDQPDIPTQYADRTTPISYIFTAVAGEDWHPLFDFGVDNAGKIGDRVWNDANGDGIQTAGEPGISGVTVRLYAADGTTLLNTLATDTSGNYQFVGLANATYVVKVDTATLPSGYAQTGYGDPGAPCGGSCNSQGTTTVSGGNTVTNVDFGYKPPANTYPVNGRVWKDLDGNGAQNGAEPGIAGVTVCLYDSTGTNVVACTTTQVTTGDYTFPGTPNGAYVIKVDPTTLPAGGFIQTGDPNGTCPGAACDNKSQVTVNNAPVTNQNFGYQQPLSSISGTVCYGNGNGDCTTGEPVAVGVPVYLTYAGPDGIFGTPDDVTTPTVTDGSGNYTFPNLPGGAYQVTKLDPPGATSLADADGGNPNNISIILTPGQNKPNQDFEMLPAPGAIGDRVWLDENGNGLQDAGEDGIPNAKAQLYAANGTTLLATTYTDANGGYLFPALQAGTYVVKVDPASLPAGLAANPTYDEDGVGTANQATVTLASGEEHLTTDFGYNWAPTNDVTGNTGTGAIGDRVWADTNGNGVQDPGEAGLGNVSVELVTAGPDGRFGTGDDVVAATTTTNAAGNYIFDGLAAGGYVVRIPTPLAGYTQTGDPDGTLDNQTTQPIVLAPGDVFVEADFGYAPQDGLPNSLGDTVWLDVDRDGVQDAGEASIPGVTVQLTWAGPDGNLATPADNVVYTTVTDDNGNYLFSDLPDGNFQVTTNLPSNTGPGGPLEGLLAAYDGSGSPTDGTSDVALDPTHTTSGPVTNLAQDFGYSPNDGAGNEGLIGDTIFFDANGNGRADPGEGIPGVKVTLSGAASAVTTTDANGNYTFAGLAAGTYAVTVDTSTLPGGLTNSVDPDGGNNNTATVTLATNSSVNLNQDFGYAGAVDPLPNSLGDRVWLDVDRNGVQNPGEAGIGGVLVQLTWAGPDGNLATPADNVVYTTVTDVNGGYLFTDLPDGNFRVTTNLPSNTGPGGPLEGLFAAYDASGSPADGTSDVALDPTHTASGPVTNLAQDFGYSPNDGAGNEGLIGDTIFFDANGNGVADPGEGIPGVKVTLDGSTVTYTDANGNYYFGGLAAGAHTVVVDPATLPAGLANTFDPDGGNDNQATVTLAANEVRLDQDFGYQATTLQLSAIGDTVWVDANRDNTRNAGEPGIPGVSVALIRDTNGNGVWDAGEPIIATDITDANGQYSFTGVPTANGVGTDDYLVWVNDTANVLAPLVATYDVRDGASQGNPTPGVVTGLTISAVTNLDATPVTNADFAFAPVGQDASEGLIGDTIYLDRNGNLTPDAGEGLEGVKVQLYAANGTTLLETTTTNENGQYFFGGLSPTATYVVKVDTGTLPGGLTNTVDPDGGTANQSTVNLATSGPTNLNQDFGYDGANTIAGTLWQDTDADGLLDGGESGGWAGVTVVLLDANNNVVGTTTTDANGNYSFGNLPDGTFKVDVTDDGNVLNGAWKSTGPTPGADNNSQADPYPVTVSGGQTNSTADFGYYNAPAGLGNYVWRDLNANGIQDVGEPGLAGVEVTLTITWPSAGGSSTVKTTTDANGYYSFGNLLLDENMDGAGAGEPTFTIAVATPSGYVPTLVDQGSNDALDSDPSGVTATTTEGTVNTSYDFGFVKQSGTIGDRVWLDENGNGLQDAGEDGIANVKVTVTKGAETYTTYTDAAGGYVFKGLGAGNWTVTVDPASLPAGLAANPTYDENGAGTPHTTTVALASGEEHLTTDFGYNWAPTSDVTGNTGTGAIGDRVWADTNGNGVQDPGEAGLGNVSVELVTAGPDGRFGTGDDVVAATTTTNAAGNYIFDGLAAGGYVVRILTPPAGYTQTGDPDGTLDNQTTQPIVLAPGDVFVEADFGYAPQDGLPNSLGDTVWLDVDRDGVQDAGEAGIGGVLVQLTWAGPDGNLATPADNVVYTTVTDDNGNYLFSDLPDGNFQVTTNLPSNTGAGGPLEGLLAAYDGSGSPTDGTSDVALDPTHTTSGPVTNLAQDFGYSPNDGTGNEGLIGDTIFFDANGNGRADPGEGIPGVKVTLSGAASAVATTDANGNYTFAGLAAGTYAVTVDTSTLPGGLTNSVDPDGGNNNTATLTLATNSSVNLNQDFGYAGAVDPLPNSLGDRVWLDVDRDGVQDPGEAGIGGVLVQLTWAGPDGNLATPADNVVYTTVTDVNGGYLFTDLPDGNFNVTTNLPSNTGPGGPLEGLFAAYDASGSPADGTSDVALDPTHTASGPVTNLAQDFGYSPNDGAGNEGLIGDTIFFDANGNDVADPGEGIPGVKVTLDGSTVTYTDANGYYYFGGLAAGAHTVVVDSATLPAGLSNTFDPDGGNDNQATVTLAANEVRLDQDFGYQATTLQLSAIGDTVWVDANRDNTRNAGEPGIPGVSVALIRDTNGNGVWDAGEPIIATDITDANGNYQFGGLPTVNGVGTDDYLVWVNDTANVLAPLVATYDVRDGANQGNPTPGVVTGLTISAVTHLDATPVTNADFAFAPVGQDAGEGLIGDTIYLDRNGNQTPDAGEGLEGVKVQLYAANGTTLLETTTTNENGQYFFGSLNPTATYVVKVDTGTLPGGLTNTVDPDGGTANQSTVNLATSGPTNLNQDFGYDGANTIAGTLWQDTDADGLLDGGESGGWAGVTVVLLDANNNVVGTTTTDANGNYSFGNLPDGTFKVDVTDDGNVLNGAWKSTGPTPGADNNSQADPYPVTVSGGQTNSTADFGYYNAPAGLGNYVWRDLNANGIQDVGEPGLAGVEVTLTITWPSAGGSSTVKTTTDASGYYSFGNLLLDENMDGVGGAGAGEPTFTIAVATPAGYVPTLSNQGSNDALDSDLSGVTATTTEGTVNTSYDFGFVNQVPDVTPVITAVPNVMTGITHFNIFVQVTELLVVPTNGLITVRVPKDTRWVFDGPYDSTLTVLGGTPLNNPVWAYSQNTTQHIFTTTATIPAGGFSTFGFKALWNAGQTQGLYTITSQIDSFSGGENRIDNNSDAEKLDYFIN